MAFTSNYTTLPRPSKYEVWVNGFISILFSCTKGSSTHSRSHLATYFLRETPKTSLLSSLLHDGNKSTVAAQRLGAPEREGPWHITGPEGVETVRLLRSSHVLSTSLGGLGGLQTTTLLLCQEQLWTAKDYLVSHTTFFHVPLLLSCGRHTSLCWCFGHKHHQGK